MAPHHTGKKGGKFLHITFKIFPSLAPPHSKCTTISTHTDNCQKHPTTSCLHGFTQAAISSFTYILPNHNTCKIPPNLYQIKYHFSQMFQIPCPGGIKLSQSYVLMLPLSQHLSVIFEFKKLSL